MSCFQACELVAFEAMHATLLLFLLPCLVAMFVCLLSCWLVAIPRLRACCHAYKLVAVSCLQSCCHAKLYVKVALKPSSPLCRTRLSHLVFLLAGAVNIDWSLLLNHFPLYLHSSPKLHLIAQNCRAMSDLAVAPTSNENTTAFHAILQQNEHITREMQRCPQ